MTGFKDIAPVADEAKDARMNFRTTPRIKAAIQQAAALYGLDDSAFALGAAYEKALAVIAAHEETILRPEDHAAFFGALDKPSAPSEALRQAFALHGRKVAPR